MRIIIEIDDRSLAVQRDGPLEPPAAVNTGGPPQALVDRLGAQAPRAAAGSVASPTTAGAIDAGGPPADLLKLLGAQPPRPAGAASSGTASAINAGGPPADLLAARAKQS
jgi:hypothetical protein